MSRRCLFPCLLLLLAVPSGAQSAEPSASRDAVRHPAAALAGRIWSITEVVFDRHVEPPARQEMLLAALQGLYRAAETPAPVDLVRRVSAVTTQEQFGELLRTAWPKGDTLKREAMARLENAALSELVLRLPGTGQLMTPEGVKFAEQIRGNRYVGIGVQIRLNPEEKRAMLVTPIRGGPAHRAGLKPRDLLLEVDGKSTEGEALGPLVQRLRGAEGTTVTLVVRQPGEKETRRVKLTRAVVPFENVQGFRRADGDRIWDFRVEPTGAIAYAVIRSITSSTLHELRQLDRRLRDDKAQALILDLRLGNGGDLQHSAHVADGLLDGGTLWHVRDARGQLKARKADRDCLFRDMPIVVLVSQPVLRGVPWLAAALQDNGRAVIVGESLGLSPFAHGEVDLPDGGKLVLATGRLERAKKPVRTEEPTGLGTSSRFMLEPDHVVTLSRKQREVLAEWFHTKDYTELPKDMRDDPPQDPGLAKAIEVLRAKVKASSSVRNDREP